MSASVVGESFGPYRVESPLGRGGMGEVYVAKDDRLGRRVALKLLPPELHLDEERRTRFLREARAASALNHSNIVTIYDVGRDRDRDYYVMELVEGESLRSLMQKRRGVTPQRAFEICAQIASALAAAHASGIVHRDVKPENIVITTEGDAKILDYGIAKITEPTVPISTVETTMPGHSPTVPGAIIGTIAYMSPEQAQGAPVDGRSDIFSLGVVLYELLAGRQPFTGSSTLAQLQAIVATDPPPITTVAPDVPEGVEEILEKALAKEKSQRYASAADFRLDLLRLSRRPTRSKPQQRKLSSAVIAALLLAVSAAAVLAFRSFTATAPPSLADVALTPLTTEEGYEGEPTFSPDGQTIAYVSGRNGNLDICLKQISGGPDVNLTNHPSDDVQPSISPDGKQIAFVSSRESRAPLVYRNPTAAILGGDIWVMPTLGGKPRKIAEQGNFPSWSPDGKRIVYTTGQWRNLKIFQTPAEGGKPVEIPITVPNGHIFVFRPAWSPDGRWLLFEAQPDAIYVVPAAGGKAKLVVNGRSPTWGPSGKSIVYSSTEPQRNFSLWQIEFDPRSGNASNASPLTVGRGRDMQAVVSRDGRFIAFASQQVSFTIEKAAFDEIKGRIVGEPKRITSGAAFNCFFDVSPDARSVVYEVHRGVLVQLWRIDDDGAVAELTNDPLFSSRYPAWSPKGDRIHFVRRRAAAATDAGNAFLMRPDGGNPEPLGHGGWHASWSYDGRYIADVDPDDARLHLYDLATKQDRRLDTGGKGNFQCFSPDGKWLVYQQLGDATDIRALPLAGGSPITLVATPRDDFHPSISHDGQWLYFQYDHKNLLRIPGPAQQWKKAPPQQVTFFPESNLYIEDPTFSRDGKWLFYSRGKTESDVWLMELPKRD